MTNKEVYNLAIEHLEKNFGRGAYGPRDALDLAYFLQEELGGEDGIE
jgi:hypothetical protein